MRVTHLQRRVGAGVYSLERYFSTVRHHLPPEFDVETAIAPYESKSFWPRIANVFWARGCQADVTHVTGDIHYVSFLLTKSRTVLTILDCIFMHHPSRIRRRALELLWLRIPEKRVAVITTISEFTRQQVISSTHCDPSKVKVVYACVSPWFKPIHKAWNAECPTLLHVGTGGNKNLERLCQAIQGLRCHLHVVGRLSASQKNALRGVEYTNSVYLDDDQMLHAYATCDVLSFVSTYEGFGLPIVEANAVGRPVVTSRAASMPEIAGNSACLVDPLDVASIRAGVVRVFDSVEYRSMLVANGFENAKRFDPASIARQYASIYESLIPPEPVR